MKKLIFVIIAFMAAAANLAGKADTKELLLHLPSGDVEAAGYSYNLTDTVDEIGVESYVIKHISIHVADFFFSVSNYTVWQTNKPSTTKHTHYAIEAGSIENEYNVISISFGI